MRRSPFRLVCIGLLAFVALSGTEAQAGGLKKAKIMVVNYTSAPVTVYLGERSIVLNTGQFCPLICGSSVFYPTGSFGTSVNDRPVPGAKKEGKARVKEIGSVLRNSEDTSTFSNAEGFQIVGVDLNDDGAIDWVSNVLFVGHDAKRLVVKATPGGTFAGVTPFASGFPYR